MDPLKEINANIVGLQNGVLSLQDVAAHYGRDVEEVFEADTAALETVPSLGARWPEIYVKGVVRHTGDLVILLDTDTLFRPEG